MIPKFETWATIALVEALVILLLALLLRRRQPVFFRECWRSLPFVDAHSGEISITRCIAIYFALMLGHMIEDRHPLSGTQLTFAIVILAAAFGKSTFTFFLQRYEVRQQLAEIDRNTNENRVSTSTVNVHVDETKRIIDERHAEDGSPPKSMPPVGVEVPE